MSVQNWYVFGGQWPNFGPLVAKNDWKWAKMVVLTIIWKIIHTIIIKLVVYTCFVIVQLSLTFGQRWSNFDPLVAKKLLKSGSTWWFPTVIWKCIHTIQFKLGVYTNWVSVQNWFALWPRWPNFGPVMPTKWLKIVVSDHYLKKY